MSIKYDLNGLVGGIDKATQSLQKLEAQYGSIANTAKRTANEILSSFNNGQTGPAANTNASKDFAQAQNPEYFKVMQEFQKVDFGPQAHNSNYVLSKAGKLFQRQQDATGESKLIDTNYSVSAFMRAQQANRDMVSRFSGLDTPDTRGFGAKDIPKITNLALNTDRLASTLSKQAGSFARGDDTAQVVSRVLAEYSDRLKTKQQDYKGALANYSNSLNNPDENIRTEAIKELTKAMASLTRTVADASEASSSSGSPSGGFLNAVKGNIGSIAGVANLGYAGYGAYTQVSMAYQQANLGGFNQAYINQSALRGGELQRQADYYSISSAEGLVRSRGDLIFGKQASPFLGREGRERAVKNAQAEENARIELLKQGRTSGMIGEGVKGALMGGIGGLLSGNPILGVLGGVVGGVGSAVSSYIGNEATALDGGMFGVLNGTGAQAKALTASAQNVQNRATQLQEANALALLRGTRGIGGIDEMRAVQQQGALSVGGYAMTKDRLMQLVGEYSPLPATARPVRGGSVDIDAVRSAIASIESGGNYNAVNPSTGASGKYQIMPRGAFAHLAMSKYGLSVADMAQDHKMTEAFFSKEMMPEYIRSAQSMQRRLPQAQGMDINVLTGLMQLGAGNVETYLRTGVDKTGGQIPGYMSGLQKRLGPSRPALAQTAPDIASDDSAFNADLARQSVFAKNQVGYTEFAGKYNSLINAVGYGSANNDKRVMGINPTTGLSTLEGQTMEMIRLERGGLGDFQSNVGNMTALNRVNGSDNNFKALEGILGNAVAAGFDRSRMAQTFVRTTTELTQAIGSTNAEYVGGNLARQAGAFSLTGQANELSLNQASQAVQQYAQITNGSGIVGVGKNLGALSAGYTATNGGGILSAMNAPQSMAVIGELKSGHITSLEADSLVRETMRTKGVSREVAMKMSADAIGASVTGANSVLLAQMGRFTGGDLGKQMDKLRTLKEGTKEYNDTFASIRAMAVSGGYASGIGGLAGLETVVTSLTASGAMTAKGGKSALEQAKKNGEDLVKDPLKVQMQAFIDSAVRETTSKTKGLSVGEYIASASSGARDLSFTSGPNAGQTIDSQKLAYIQGKAPGKRTKEENEYLAHAEKDLKDTDRIERARSAAIAKTETSTAQRVVVDNFQDLLTGLIPKGGANILNGSGRAR